MKDDEEALARLKNSSAAFTSRLESIMMQPFSSPIQQHRTPAARHPSGHRAERLGAETIPLTIVTRQERLVIAYCKSCQRSLSGAGQL
jgi:hypothetical protein